MAFTTLQYIKVKNKRFVVLCFKELQFPAITLAQILAVYFYSRWYCYSICNTVMQRHSYFETVCSQVWKYNQYNTRYRGKKGIIQYVFYWDHMNTKYMLAVGVGCFFFFFLPSVLKSSELINCSALNVKCMLSFVWRVLTLE